jgi:protein-disulfide isomerase
MAGEQTVAQACRIPTTQKLEELSAYVVKRNHLDPAGQLVLLESAPMSATCYWRLHYRESLPTPNEFTLYLSPDGRYLFPSVYDSSSDPLAEERAAADKLMRTLEAHDPPSLGNADAPITIVEFSDFQCPFCKRLSDVLEKGLTAEERKDIRLVFRNYPLPMHAWAKDAAEVAACAALQSDAAFWKMHDYLFQNQATLTTENVRTNATAFALESANIDKEGFRGCLNKRLAVGGLESDMDLGKKNGVHVTPTMFINGTKYEGTRDAAALRVILDEARRSQRLSMASSSVAPAPTK